MALLKKNRNAFNIPEMNYSFLAEFDIQELGEGRITTLLVILNLVSHLFCLLYLVCSES